MKIATFKRMGEYGYDTVSDDGLENCKEYVRTSEYVDVTFAFPPLESREIVEKQLAQLDAAEAEVRNRFQEALNAINSQRAELRAITYQS